MFWPGMGDPSKRKKTLKFLAISAAVGVAVVLISTTVISQIKLQDPLYHKCLNGLNIQYHVSATLEVLVDGKKWIRPISTTDIPLIVKGLWSLPMMEQLLVHGKVNIHLR